MIKGVKGSEKGVKGSVCSLSLPFIFFLSLLLTFNPLQAQRVEPVKPVEVRNVVVPHEHSASKALMLSLLPGAGQVYNGQAWKVPIIYGAFTGIGYFIHYNYTRMVKFKDEYLYRVNHNDTPNLPEYASYPTSGIYNLYNSYNRDFQLMIILAVGVYALNLIDAYVFGHLYDFQIDDNLSLALSPGLQPTPAGFQPTFGVTLSF